MQIILRLAPVRYQAGMVIMAMGWKPIAESAPMELKNAKQLQAEIATFTEPHRGKVDAKVVIYGYGRKFAGFDDVKRKPVELTAI